MGEVLGSRPHDCMWMFQSCILRRIAVRLNGVNHVKPHEGLEVIVRLQWKGRVQTTPGMPTVIFLPRDYRINAVAEREK